MADEDDFSTLTLQQRLSSTKWKARVHAYEELFKRFSEAEEDSASIFREFASAIKTIMEEKNVIAQEKGMPTLVTWVDRATMAPRNAPSICKKLIEKCICARAKTQELTKQALLLFVERDQADAVLKCLFAGTKNKVPKISAASIDMIRIALEAFGARVISAKTILANLPVLFEFNDNKAREATMSLAKELYKYIGSAPLKACLSNIRSAQMKDLEDFFESEPSGTAKPQRFTRAELAKAQESKFEDAEVEEEELDSFNLIPSVDIMSKITDDFFELIESKKWKERQEQIDFLVSIVNAPRLTSNPELAKVYRALKKVIAKDVNIMVVTKAIEAVGYLAIGLRNDFSQAAKIMIQPLLERLKEKKPKVLSSVHTTLDALYHNCIILSDFVEELCNVFSTHKLPNVRAESLKFLLRCLQEPSKRLKGRPPVGKNDVKVIARAAIVAMDDSSGDVRDLAAQNLGTLTGIVGERVTQPFLAKLDGVRLKKVKAAIPEQITPVAIPETVTISKKDLASISNKSKASGTRKQETTKPSSRATPQKPTTQKPARIVKPISRGSKPPTTSTNDQTRRQTNRPNSNRSNIPNRTEQSVSSKPTVPPKVQDSFDYKHLMNIEEIQAELEELLTETVLLQVCDSQWQERQSAVQIIQKMIDRLIEDQQLTQYSDILVCQLTTKPGWKESNFNVMNSVLDALLLLIKSNNKLSKGAAAEIIAGATPKLADVKNKNLANECLTALAECKPITPCFVIDHVMKHSIGHRNPKVIQEALGWICERISDFGSKNLDIRSIVDFCKSAYSNTNPHVRTNATSLLIVLRRYVGPVIRDLLKDIKPAILVTIDKEFEKAANLPPLIPSKNASEVSRATMQVTKPIANVATPKKDAQNFSKCITTDLLDQLHDKDWKERKQALTLIQTLLHRYSKVPLSASLLHALTERLNENNGSLLTQTLNIFESLIPAIGQNIEKNLTFVPGLLRCLGDSKKPIVSAATRALENLSKQVSMNLLIDFFPDAMETSACSQVLQFLSEEILKCGNEINEYLSPLIVPTLTALTNRSPDVRQAGISFATELVKRLGYESVLDQTKQLRPGVQKNVIAVLEKLAPPRQTPASRTPKKSPAPSRASSSILIDSKQKTFREENPTPWFVGEAKSSHVSSLKKQMVGNINSDLISCLFGGSSQCLQGIQKLTNVLNTLQNETIACLDLLFKWATLQIASSSQVVLRATCEYLIALFDMLDSATYTLTQNESVILFPVLVYHQGQCLRSFRDEDHADDYYSLYSLLFASATKIFPGMKLMKFLCSGVRNVNDSECVILSLEEISKLILRSGVQSYLDTCDDPKKFLNLIIESCKDSDSQIQDAGNRTLASIHKSLQNDFWQYFDDLSTAEQKWIQDILDSNDTKALIQTRHTPVESSDDSKDFIAHETFMDWCKILETKKASRCIQVMKLVCLNVEQDNIQVSEADKLANHLSALSESIFNENPIDVRFCKYSLRTWQVIFSKKHFVNAISIKHLKSIIQQILHELQNAQLTAMGDTGKQIIQALYNAVLLILNNYDRSDVIVIFLELLQNSMKQVFLEEKYIDCLVKCLLKLAKTLGATIHTLDLDKILIGLNEFFLNAPKNEDLPCKPHRMIKTILNEIVRLEGVQILKHLDSAFPTNQEKDVSPVCGYAQQFLAAQKPATTSSTVVSHNAPKDSPSAGLDVKDKQILLEIFKNVRSKDPKITNDALMDLYRFQVKNPSINFDPFLERTSKTFRDFITNSLASIRKQEENKEKTEKLAQEPISDAVENNSPNTVVKDEITPKANMMSKHVLAAPPTRVLDPVATNDNSDDLAESYMEKLTRLRHKYKNRGGQTETLVPVVSSSARATKPTAEYRQLDMPKPSLTDIKKQLQDVKAMSPQKKGKTTTLKYSPASSPSSPAPTPSALADLKNQLDLLKNRK